MPKPVEKRGRGHPKVYSDRLFLKALVGIFFVTVEENEHELPENTHFCCRKFHRICGKSPRFHRSRRKSLSVAFWKNWDFFERTAPAPVENFSVSVEKIRGEPFGKKSCVAAAPPGMKPWQMWPCSFSL